MCNTQREERIVTELKIYGEHDERTVSQMWRCMGVGSVAGGVLCADGHLGYAQPVGGVIAYEDHVSDLGRRLRHRLRQHGGAHQPQVRGHQGPRAGDRQRHRQARSASAWAAPTRSRSTTRCSIRRCGTTPASAISSRWRARSSAPSAPATTTSTCSKTRTATCGSACTSARAASATRARRTTSSSPAARTASTSRRRSSTSTASSASATSRR